MNPLLFALMLGTIGGNPPQDEPLPTHAVARIGTTRFRHDGQVEALTYSSDGTRLTTLTLYNASMWDVRSGRRIAFFQFPSAQMWSAVSPNGAYVVPHSKEGVLTVHDLAANKECFSTTGKRVLAFSQDGRWLAAADEERTIFLIDLAEKKIVRQWKSPADERCALSTSLPCNNAFTTDGKTLICASKKGSLLIFDTDAGKERRRIDPEKPSTGYHPLAVARDGRTVAKANYGKIELWDLQTGGALAVIATDEVEDAPIFVSDSKELIWRTRNGSICFWDVAKEAFSRSPHRLSERYGRIHLALAPDGRTYATADDNDHAIRFWDCETGKELCTDAHGFACPVSARFLSDGKTLLTTSAAGARNPEDRKPRLWNLQGKLLATWKVETPEQGHYHPFAFTPDGRCFARMVPTKDGRHSNMLQFQDSASANVLGEVKMNDMINSLSFSPDGRFLWVGSPGYGGGAGMGWMNTVYRGPAPEKLEKIQSHHSSRRDGFVSFAGVSDWFYRSAEGRPGWDFYHVETSKKFRSFSTHYGFITGVSPSGRVLLCRDFGQEAPVSTATAEGPVVKRKSEPLVLMEFESGKIFRKLAFNPPTQSLHAIYGARLLFSPDGRFVAGGGDGDICFWDVCTGRKVGNLKGHRGWIRSLCFSGDGRFLVSGSNDTTVLIWDWRKAIEKDVSMPTELPAKRLTQIWHDLQGEDAACAYRAAGDLVQTPAQAIPYLKEKMLPAIVDDVKNAPAWIANLDSGNFQVRSQATSDLAALGELAAPALKDALGQAKSLESKRRIEELLEKTSGSPPSWLRLLRSVEVLELIGTRDARQLLEELDSRLPESRLKAETQRSAKRLKARGG